MRHNKLISHKRDLPHPAVADNTLALCKELKAYRLEYTLYVIHQYLTGGEVIEAGK